MEWREAERRCCSWNVTHTHKPPGAPQTLGSVEEFSLSLANMSVLVLLVCVCVCADPGSGLVVVQAASAYII